MKKRTILSAAIMVGSVILVGPFGLSPAILLVGLVLSVLIYNKGDRTAVELIQRGRVTVTEIREKWNKPEEPVRPDAPTLYDLTAHDQKEPITGHFRPMEPDPAPAPSPVTVPPDPPEPPTADDPAFVIGRTEDGRNIELDEISSLGVGGVPGSGKTVSMVGLATQAVVKYKGDVRFLLVDPHMNSGSPEALSARMAPLAPFYLRVPGLSNPVSGGGNWVKWLKQHAKDRIGGKVPRDQQFKIVLMADEFTALLDDPEISEPLTELLLLINEQARKVGIFALVASPAWKSSRIQGTDVRNTIASFLVHQMQPNIARQLLPYEEAEKANRLAKGQAIFSSFGVVDTVRVPFMSKADIERCIKPYLPPEKPSSNSPIPVSGRGKDEEPGIATVKAIWETYMILNTDLRYEEANAIRALAIDFYPGDPDGIEKVKRALKLGEEHL